MTTRCKDGDLTVITHDVPSCAANIGRVVRLSGPVLPDGNGRLAWLIEPITDEPYMINDLDGRFIGFMGYQEKGFEHPDEWMQPITQNPVDQQILETTDVEAST